MKRILLSTVAAAMFGLMPSVASARSHSSFFFGLNLGGVGIGYGASGHRSFFDVNVGVPAYSSGYCAPSYYSPAPVYVAPPVYSAPQAYYYAPQTYCAPTYYAPTYVAPTYVAPTYYGPTYCAPPVVYSAPVATYYYSGGYGYGRGHYDHYYYRH